jgi:hypothetical protein
LTHLGDVEGGWNWISVRKEKPQTFLGVLAKECLEGAQVHA